MKYERLPEIHRNFETIPKDCKNVSIKNAGAASSTADQYFASLIFTKSYTKVQRTEGDVFESSPFLVEANSE